jgi:hypothetical protein
VKKSTSPSHKGRAGSKSKGGRRPCRHRQIIPGATWLITRKTNDDLFWLAPSPLVNAILLFLLALKAKKYGILVHAYFFASNHFHLVVTDPRGKLPAFQREFLGESSKAIQVARNTDRPIWSCRRYSAVQILDRDAAERESAYCGLQSAEAELTLPEEWPGLTSIRYRFGDTVVARRPEVYFTEDRPESVELVHSPLPKVFVQFAEESDASSPAKRKGREEAQATAERDPESDARIREIVSKRTAEIRADLAKRKKKLAGRERVLRTPCTKRTTHPVRALNPRFATRDRELLEQAIASYRQFEVDHEAARERYVAGRWRTQFPVGTYGYRVMLGVRVARRRRRAA